LDQKQLPEVEWSYVCKEGKFVEPSTDDEINIAAIWSSILRLKTVSLNTNFFAAGGTSILASQLVTQCRILGYPHANIKTLMLSETLGGFVNELVPELPKSTMPDSKSGDHARESCLKEDSGTMESVTENEMVLNPWLMVLLQTLLSSTTFAVIISPFAVVYLFLIEGQGGTVVWVLTPLVTSTAVLASIVIAAGLKWVILGKVQSGSHRLYSIFFLRWWLVRQITTAMGTFVMTFLQETAYMSWYLRLLGATIGNDVKVNTIFISEFDQVFVGDKSVIGLDVNLAGHEFRDGLLTIGLIMIGPKCVIGPRCILSSGASVPSNVELLAGSVLSNTILESDVVLHAARREASCLRDDCDHPGQMYSTTLICLHALGFLSVMVVYLLIFVKVPLLLHSQVKRAMSYVGGGGQILRWTILILIVPECSSMMFLAYVAIATRVLTGHIEAGTYECTPLFALRIWYVDRLCFNMYYASTCSLVPRTIIGWYYSCRGITIGARSFFGSGEMMGACAQMITIGDDVFIGDSNYFIPYKHVGHNILVTHQTLADLTQVGNWAVFVGEVNVERRNMIGSKSVISSDTVMQPDSAYMGCPAVMVGNRFLSAEDTGRMVHSVRNCASEDSTDATDFEDDSQDSRTIRYWIYTIQSVLVLVLFDVVVALTYASFTNMIWTLYALLGWWCVSLLPLMATTGLIMMVVMLWLLKRFLVGNRYQGQAPLYSWKFMSQEYMGMIQGLLFSFILWMIEGTPLMNMCLRLMGAKVGSRVWFDTIPPVELDLLEIGDNSIIDHNVLIVPHTMDYGKMQFSPIVIGTNCVVSMDCLLMPGTFLNYGVELMTGTVSSKDEGFPPYTRYQGNCAEFVSARQPEVIEDCHEARYAADGLCKRSSCPDLCYSNFFLGFAMRGEEFETGRETEPLLPEDNALRLKYIV